MVQDLSDIYSTMDSKLKQRLALFLIIYVVFGIAIAFVAGGRIIGIDPLIGGILPIWVLVLYLLFVPIIIGYIWLYDALDEYILGEDSRPLLGGEK